MDTRSLRQEVFAANFFGSYAEFFRNRPWVCLLQTDGPLNFRISYEGTTQGTRATISAPFEPKRFSIFSYEAEAEFDVAVWREAEGELQLLWERNNVPGVGYGWIDLPIAPGELPMSPGAYWLTWSARGPGRPAGRIPGQPGDGIVFTRPDGPLAVPLAGAQITDDRWGMFLSDDTTPAGWLVR
ncbi:MAG: hypothetical protein SF028_07330 [Candidatus Sumerlaeia bacterium]|nr:hypothetical protein [Candidatus Sumerlaeia bacterium]